MTLEEMQKAAHQNSMAKGWWDEQKDLAGELEPGLVEAEIPTKLCLIHSEVSEALEEFRNRNPHVYLLPGCEKPEGLGVELADVVIRIGDLCGALGIDLQQLVRMKMQYNATRPHRHGGKRA